MADGDTTVTVIGSVRRGAAIVEDTAIDLTQDGDDLRGERHITVTGDSVLVNVTIFGEPSTTFEVKTAIEGLGIATRKAKLVTDVALRGWEIELTDFEAEDDDDE